MAITPLSVQLEDKIVLHKRERVAKSTKEALDAQTILTKLAQASELQTKLGLGTPRTAVQRHKENLGEQNKLLQAEKLADKFLAVKEPQPQFFPRFTKTQGNWQAGSNPSAIVRGRLPELAMVKLEPGLDMIHCTQQGTGNPKYSQAPIPVIPLSALELASRAKAVAPDAEFHMLFMPSWEPAPQRDPVLLAHLPNTDEWFKIAQWDGDVDLINEFLEDK